ncbi:MAG: hypothetical protein KDJ72_01250 [Methyloceanibacter sp.]|uniref:DUF6455 family protein n=1 Tax=Methyloceanibacter sp. TaxID=1965321 RepID=UPI001D596CA2|nr:DUF6455 family protein [Methyloceanibacter sp.]MCB1441622.1 hypothetical protein [Methyloceanibacter sp.]MCC0058648.1 hypothetical protein [Hyphomicrobiaceae bacterium]
MRRSRLLWSTNEELRQRYALMEQMMETQGVDVLSALRVDGGLAFVEARAKCRYCRHAEVCRRWLLGKGQQGEASFCPNAAFFRSCPDLDD